MPVEKSRADIETTLARYGASSFMYGWNEKGAAVAFVVGADTERRHVRFVLPLPDRNDQEFARYRRTDTEAERRWEQACRQRWRALLLVVKAKLEAVESGIATFEDEFLAYIVLPDGGTVADLLGPQVAAAYKTGQMPTGLRLELPRGSDE